MSEKGQEVYLRFPTVRRLLAQKKLSIQAWKAAAKRYRFEARVQEQLVLGYAEENEDLRERLRLTTISEAECETELAELRAEIARVVPAIRPELVERGYAVKE